MPPIVDRPEVEALTRRLVDARGRVLAARPQGMVTTGDVEPALLEIVLAELSEVLPDLDREDLATWRWLCGWEEHTVARLVCMLQRAHGTPMRGVMWCVAHDGVADECNDGTTCDRADDSKPCDLRELAYGPPTRPDQGRQEVGRG